MYFIDLWTWLNSWLSNGLDAVMGAIRIGFRTLCFMITEIIYGLIVNLYNFFDTLCHVRILNGDITGELSKRIGLILGLIMFFYVIFSLIKMLINPEKISDKEIGAGAIVKKTILVIVMLGAQNAFFNTLYDLQRIIIDSNAISKLILPYTINEDDEDKFGNLLSASLMKSFYYKENFLTNGYTVTGQNSDINDSCETLTNMFYNQIYNNNKYDIGYMCLKESIQISNTSGAIVKEEFVINFNGLLAVVAGAFVLYMLFMYCLKIGVRMIQLAFLEVISPVAIISYMAPQKSNKLSAWWNLYFSTYIDVFLRIAIIDFVVFLICVIFASNAPTDIFDFWNSMNVLGFNNDGEKVLFSVIIILALLTFAKKAPDLLKEILPGSGKGLGFGLAMKDIFGLKEFVGFGLGATTGAAIGLLGGAASGWSGNTGWRKITGFATGALGGTLGGIFRGGKAGASAKDIGKAMSSAREKQAKANLDKAQRRLAGAHWYDTVGSGINSYLGRMSGYEMLEPQVSSLNELKSDIEGEDVVKDANTTLDLAYQKYYEQTPNAKSKTDWLNTEEQVLDSSGKSVNKYKLAVDNAKQHAYNELYNNSDSAFRVKVDMHNRRFGTRYGAGSKWKKINNTRKEMAAELERERASKPKK